MIRRDVVTKRYKIKKPLKQEFRGVVIKPLYLFISPHLHHGAGFSTFTFFPGLMGQRGLLRLSSGLIPKSFLINARFIKRTSDFKELIQT